MNMQRALAASIGVAERWMTKRNVRALFGLAALIVLRRQRRRRQQRGLKTRNGRSWVKPHIREHDNLGAYVSLVESLRNGEPDEFVKFLRLTPHQFDYVLQKIAPIIARNDTRFRKCVGAEERLAITLRFLATGKLKETAHR